MRIECEKLPECFQRRIAADEQVLWCGKGRPTPFLRGFWPRMMAGCMAAAFQNEHADFKARRPSRRKVKRIRKF